MITVPQLGMESYHSSQSLAQTSTSSVKGTRHEDLLVLFAELCQQVASVVKALTAGAPLRSILLTGGRPSRTQRSLLDQVRLQFKSIVVNRSERTILLHERDACYWGTRSLH